MLLLYTSAICLKLMAGRDSKIYYNITLIIIFQNNNNNYYYYCYFLLPNIVAAYGEATASISAFTGILITFNNNKNNNNNNNNK